MKQKTADNKRFLIYTILVMEEWPSGRRHSSRKAAGVQAPRGFESHLFRQKELTILKCVMLNMAKKIL